MEATGLMPAILLMLGIGAFLATSIFTVLVDEHFGRLVPYIYQAAAVAGFGQLYVLNFVMNIGPRVAFGYNLLYLVAALANTILVASYVLSNRRRPHVGVVFYGMITIPLIVLSVLFMSGYMGPPSPMFSALPVGASLILVIFAVLILCAGLIAATGIRVRFLTTSRNLLSRRPNPSPMNSRWLGERSENEV